MKRSKKENCEHKKYEKAQQFVKKVQWVVMWLPVGLGTWAEFVEQVNGCRYHFVPVICAVLTQQAV